MDERKPVRVREPLEKHALARSASRQSSPKQPGRKYARVVGDQQIARGQKRRQVTNLRVLPRPMRSIDDEET